MEKWEIAYCGLKDVGGYLKEGWEPFAVTCLGNPSLALIWLRRKAKRIFGERIMEIDRWDVEMWAAKSRKGEVCGIFGCPNEPTTKCKHCFNMYCDEHKFVINLPGHQERSNDG